MLRKIFWLIFLSSATSFAQSTQFTQLYQSAVSVVTANLGYGWNQGSGFYGALSDGGIRTHPMKFPTADKVAIFAICDNDCTDIDISVRDSSGRVIALDNDDSDTAMVTFDTPGINYYLQVTMANCESNPCEYRAGLFWR